VSSHGPGDVSQGRPTGNNQPEEIGIAAGEVAKREVGSEVNEIAPHKERVNGSGEGVRSNSLPIIGKDRKPSHRAGKGERWRLRGPVTHSSPRTSPQDSLLHRTVPEARCVPTKKVGTEKARNKEGNSPKQKRHFEGCACKKISLSAVSVTRKKDDYVYKLLTKKRRGRGSKWTRNPLDERRWFTREGKHPERNRSKGKKATRHTVEIKNRLTTCC